VTATDLYHYLSDALRREVQQQRPQQWAFGVTGDEVVLARNPKATTPYGTCGARIRGGAQASGRRIGGASKVGKRPPSDGGEGRAGAIGGGRQSSGVIGGKGNARKRRRGGTSRWQRAPPA
jgi:hypothetical protein